MLSVFNQNGSALTNSLLVAEKFGKEHKNVLRDIDNFVAQNSAAKSYFIEGEYENRVFFYDFICISPQTITKSSFQQRC